MLGSVGTGQKVAKNKEVPTKSISYSTPVQSTKVKTQGRRYALRSVRTTPGRREGVRGPRQRAPVGSRRFVSGVYETKSTENLIIC